MHALRFSGDGVTKVLDVPVVEVPGNFYLPRPGGQ